MAIVGGTEILLHPDQNVSMSSGGYVNPQTTPFIWLTTELRLNMMALQHAELRRQVLHL